MKHLLALSLFLGFAAAGCNAQTPPAADVQQTLDRYVGTNDIGVVVGVIDHGRMRFYSGGSVGGHPPSERTVFQIGSVTKTFTATLLALMVQDGEVALDDPIQKYLPPGSMAPEFDGHAITLLNLAEQNSGLPRLMDIDLSNVVNPYASYTRARLYNFLSHYTLTRAPGAQYEYSNFGVTLLGDILARRAHMGYAALLRKRVLGPLGLAWTGVAPTPGMKALLAPGFTEKLQPAQPWDFGELGGAGALYSNAHDMLRYLQANMNAPAGLLGKALAFAQLPRTDAEPKGVMQIGLLWMTNPHSGITWHNGQVGGYHAFIGFNEKARLGVVVLANTADDGADTIGVHVLAPYIQGPKALQP